MNKKQLIFMWLGVAAIVFFAFVTIVGAYRPNYANFAIWAFLVALVASGLIYTLRDKKGQGGEKIKRINLRRGFRRITHVLGGVAAICGVAIAIGTIVDEHNIEQRKLNRLLTELELDFVAVTKKGKPIPTFNLMISLDKDTWNSMSEEKQLAAIRADKERERKKIEEGFWINLPKGSLVGLCILAGLGGAATGYGGVWLVYLLMLRVYQFIRWLATGFYDVNQEREGGTAKETGRNCKAGDSE